MQTTSTILQEMTITEKKHNYAINQFLSCTDEKFLSFRMPNNRYAVIPEKKNCKFNLLSLFNYTLDTENTSRRAKQYTDPFKRVSRSFFFLISKESCCSHNLRWSWGVTGACNTLSKVSVKK